MHLAHRAVLLNSVVVIPRIAIHILAHITYRESKAMFRISKSYVIVLKMLTIDERIARGTRQYVQRRLRPPAYQEPPAYPQPREHCNGLCERKRHFRAKSVNVEGTFGEIESYIGLTFNSWLVCARDIVRYDRVESA